MKKLSRILILIILLFVVDFVYPQGGPPPPDGGGGPGTVDDIPINFLIFPFLIIGAYLGFLFKEKLSK